MVLTNFRSRIASLAKYDALWFAVLFCCLFLLSYRFLGLWFQPDDSCSIYAATQDIPKLFLDRDTYLAFYKFFYTPLLPVAFKLDLALFGLNPLGYHLHNLIAAFLCGIVGYKLNRLFMPRFESWVGTYLFLLSYPVITIVGWLSMTHYLWGMFFVLLSFYLFKKAEIENRDMLLLSSLFFYAAACLCKEAFAPLPAIILLLGSGPLKQRVCRSIPYFFLMAGYFLLRTFMIGGFGGYIGGNFGMKAAGLAIRLVNHLILFSKSVWGIKIVFLLPLLMLWRFGVRNALKFLCLLALVAFPFLFVQAVDEYFAARLILLQFASAFLFSFVLYGGKSKKFKFSPLLFVSLFFVLQIMNAQSSYAVNKRLSEHYKKLTAEILDRGREPGKVIAIVEEGGIFYNYYYEAFRALNMNDGYSQPGAIITLRAPQDMLVVGETEYKSFGTLYLNNRWVDLAKEPANPLARQKTNDALAPPRVKIKRDGRFITVHIDDKREGEIYGVLRKTLSERNICLRSISLPRKVSFSLGLARGEAGYLFYCEKGQCSQPVTVSQN